MGSENIGLWFSYFFNIGLLDLIVAIPAELSKDQNVIMHDDLRHLLLNKIFPCKIDKYRVVAKLLTVDTDSG